MKQHKQPRRHSGRRGARRSSGRITGALLSVLVLVLTGIVVMWHWPRTAPAMNRDPGHAHPAAGRTAAPGPARSPFTWLRTTGHKLTPHQKVLRSVLPDPRHRMLLGAFTNLSGETSAEASIEQREAAMGRRYDLENTYYNWTDPFPDFGEATIAAHGRIPVMAWYGPGRTRSSHFDLAEINDGSDDAWITRQAEAIREFGKPIFLRPLIEMNGNWFEGYSGHPAAFIAAWRRIYGLFKQAGAYNVIWVWCPNVSPRDWDRYYPGNAYVDVIAADGFNNVKFGPWRSFEQLFGSFLQHFAGRKPLMIAETGSDVSEGRAAAFINGMHRYLKDVAGPRYGVIAVCWFDTNTNDSHNWRVDQTPAAWQAWLSLARDPYFGGHGT